MAFIQGVIMCLGKNNSVSNRQTYISFSFAQREVKDVHREACYSKASAGAGLMHLFKVHLNF